MSWLPTLMISESRVRVQLVIFQIKSLRQSGKALVRNMDLTRFGPAARQVVLPKLEL